MHRGTETYSFKKKLRASVYPCSQIILNYHLKNMETLTRMPWAAQNSVFQLAEIGEVSKLSKEDRLKYDHALKRYRDTLNAMTGAEMKGPTEGLNEGLEKGLAEGMEKGQQQEKAETVRRLQAMGLTVEQIAQGVELTIDEVKTLLS